MTTAVSRYHAQLRDHLETTEPELWAWFAEAANPSRETAQAAEVELLKSAYRLDGTLHDVLTADATLLSATLGIQAPCVLYQELGSTERNARVQVLDGTIHVVFSGELLDLLTPAEARVVLAHELAHADLWTRENRAWWVLDHLVHRLADAPDAHDVMAESARRLRLHTEVWADRRALFATGDPEVVVSTLVKVGAGLRTVDPAAYLAQAREILAADATATRAWTHPELHIRVACLAAAGQPGIDDTIASLVEGDDDLDHLDLLGQIRLRSLSADVLNAALAAVPAVSGVRASMLDLYNGLPEPSAVRSGALAHAQPSVRWFGASLLVDVALAEPDHADDLDDLRALSGVADHIGVGEEFDKILGRATEHSTDVIRSLRSDR